MSQEPFTGPTWDGDPRKSIDLRDKEGLALYAKGVDFQRYIRAMKLKRHHERDQGPMWRIHVSAQLRIIDRLQVRYPDFKETYERTHPR